MKHSIRYRFTVLFLAIVVGLVLLSLAINTFGLERFYRARKVGEIERAYARIDAEVEKNGQNGVNLSGILNEYSNKYNITIALIDSASSKSLITTERGSDLLLRRLQRYLFTSSGSSSFTVVKETDNYRILTGADTATQEENIDCFGYLSDNQTMVLMTTPLANLKESVLLANRFFAVAGIFTMLLGGCLIFFTTRQVTKPIQSLAAFSEKVGNLDFSTRFQLKRQDEIGVLGNNMNRMADQLEKTIGELKDANAELQEDIRKKEEIDEMRKEFIANVSHELKTPIALIQGYAEGLNDGLCEDAESRKYYLDVIIDEAGKMNSLVRQLITLSKLESGAPDLEISTFDLKGLIDGVLHNTKLMGENRGATVKAECMDESGAFYDEAVLVRADEFKIEEVLTNYVSNAFHHVNEGGSVLVSVRLAGSRVHVGVRNTGSHIPEEDLPHIWDKFYKVDKAHSRAYGGSGIGLSIVKAAMEAHSMPYGVENLDDGVNFWFELPRAVDADGKAEI